MAVDRTFDGHDLVGGKDLWLAASDPVADDVAVGRRIGVDYAGDWSHRPWRFWINGNASVSR